MRPLVPLLLAAAMVLAGCLTGFPVEEASQSPNHASPTPSTEPSSPSPSSPPSSPGASDAEGNGSGPAPNATDEPAAGNDPRRLHEVAKVVPLEVAAEDGVTLRGHVYIPDGEGPFATVLEYSPYWNTLYLESDDADEEVDGRRTLRIWLRPFMDAGFAVALVNIRGTGISDGCFQAWNPQDGPDARAVIEALAAKPWSNGKVGTHGLSYPGWTQLAAIAADPPSLQAAIPMGIMIDAWDYYTRNGAAFHETYSFGEAWTVGVGAGAFGALSHFGPGERAFVPATSPEHVCPDTANGLIPPKDPLWSGDRTPWFKARDFRDALANTTVPMMFTWGIGIMETFYRDEPFHHQMEEGLWGRMGADKRVLLGQWGHAPPQYAGREDYEATMVAWFDHYLRDGPQVVAPGVAEYQDDAGDWHLADQWPPRARHTTVHLSKRALVPDHGAVEKSTRAFQSVDTDPCPGACVDQPLAANTLGFWIKERAPACNPNQALYVSPPLAEGVRLAGFFTVNVTVSSTLPDGNFAAFLYHTPGDGACPDDEAVEVRRALTDLRHAGGTDQGEPFPVDTPAPVNVRSHEFASHVPAGHRLVLAIGGGSWELVPDARKPLLTVHTGPGVESSITLPVVEGVLRFVEE